MNEKNFCGRAINISIDFVRAEDGAKTGEERTLCYRNYQAELSKLRSESRSLDIDFDDVFDRALRLAYNVKTLVGKYFVLINLSETSDQTESEIKRFQAELARLKIEYGFARQATDAST